MKKQKLMFILHAVGGVEVWLRIILPQLNAQLFDFVVLHGNDDTQKNFVDEKEGKVKTYKTSIDRNINLIDDTRAIKDCISIIKKEQPNLIHCHSAKAGVIGKLAGAMTKTNVLYTPHAYSYLSTESKIKKFVYLTVEKLFSKLNNKVLACSHSEADRAIKDVGYKKEKALVFENGITPIEEIQKLSIEKTWPDEYICSVARPSFQKNVELTIEVLNELRKKDANIHLVLMGVGYHSPNLESVQKRIAHFGLEKNITLLEWTQREDVFNIIKKAKLYISTSRYEGLPYSVIESLALGKACVVTDADGNRDLIEDDNNGFVIFNENTQEFANKTITLLNDNEKRTAFEQAALARFNEHFNIKNTINVLEQIYRDECEKPQ